jgi:hypothetical protein
MLEMGTCVEEIPWPKVMIDLPKVCYTVLTVVQILSSFDHSLDHTSIQEMHSIEICNIQEATTGGVGILLVGVYSSYDVGLH